MKKLESPSASLKRAIAKAKREHLELTLLQQIRQAGLAIPERQVKLIPGRQWTWDFVYRAPMIAIEVQGGTWGFGAHSSGVGIARDCEKGNAANMAGWCSLTFTVDQIRSGYALSTIQEALRLNPPF